MAYPFPRFASAPQTPQHIQGMESPRDVMPRSTKPIGGYKRTGVILILVAITLLWMIIPFHASSNSTDRIPFSHDTIEEQVAYVLRPYQCANHLQATSTTSKGIKSAASHPEICIVPQALLPWMARSSLPTVIIVQAFWLP